MEKLQNVDWKSLYKTATNKVKQYTMNLSDLELKVEDATSNEVCRAGGARSEGAVGRAGAACARRDHACPMTPS